MQLWGPVFLDLDTFCALSCNAPILIPLALMEKPFSVETGGQMLSPVGLEVFVSKMN